MQADHGTGMVLTLNTMLLLGVEDTIVLFAGMPVTVDAAFHSLRAPGAILVSAEQRGGLVTGATFQALQGGRVKVLNPFKPGTGKTVRLQVRDTTSGAVPARWEGPWRAPVEWTADVGVVYRLELSKGV
jgi:hypothetical protein